MQLSVERGLFGCQNTEKFIVESLDLSDSLCDEFGTLSDCIGMNWEYKKSPLIDFSTSGEGEYNLFFNILLRCGIGYYINTNAVGIYNGKMAVAPRLFA